MQCNYHQVEHLGESIKKKNGGKNAAWSENYIFIHPQVPNRIIHFIQKCITHLQIPQCCF